MRNGRNKQPYMQGFDFWNPIISEWIASENYSEKAKEYFRESLLDMQKDRNNLTRQEMMQAGLNETLRPH